jgi:hypothetical protein
MKKPPGLNTLGGFIVQPEIEDKKKQQEFLKVLSYSKNLSNWFE